MDTLKIKLMPDGSTSIAQQILEFLTTFVPYAAVVTIVFKICDSVVKYLNDGRDSRTRAITREENAPLKEDINRLTEAIFQLKDEIRKMK